MSGCSCHHLIYQLLQWRQLPLLDQLENLHARGHVFALASLVH